MASMVKTVLGTACSHTAKVSNFLKLLKSKFSNILSVKTLIKDLTKVCCITHSVAWPVIFYP